MDTDSNGDHSLIALATRLSQVQFRLRQLSKADDRTRDLLLKDLERFAFDGSAPAEQTDCSGLSYDTAADSEKSSVASAVQRRKLLIHLRQQVEQLEKECSVQEGGNSPAQQFRHQLGLRLARLSRQGEDMEQWHNREDDPPIPRLAPPPAEASSTRRSQMKPTTSPVRHVQFAISTPPSPGFDDEPVLSPTRQSMPRPLAGSSVSAALEDDELEDAQQEAQAAKVPFLKKSVAVLEATMWLCGATMSRMVTCSTRQAIEPPATETNQLRQDIQGLEDTVSRIVYGASQLSQDQALSVEQRAELEVELECSVANDLPDRIGSLLEHGLYKEKCIPESLHRGGDLGVKMGGGLRGHWAAWKLFQEFYNAKGGVYQSSTPLHQLSSSFSLPVENGLPPRKGLLACIHKAETQCCDVPPSDAPHLKLRCLICQGFNLGYLKDWMQMLVACDDITEDYYMGYAFAKSAGFRPALSQLERLKRLPPYAPVEAHVSHYIAGDAFSTS